MKSYKIPKGKHSSVLSLPKLTLASEIYFDVIFTDSVFYFPINNDSLDWNKLYGMSDSWSHHHTDSARIAWRCKDNQIEVAPYIYIHGQRLIGPPTIVEPNTILNMGIQMKGTSYYFFIEGTRYRLPRKIIREKGLKYILKPYFGGDNVAPHDITILIK